MTILARWGCPPCWPRPSAPRPPPWGRCQVGHRAPALLDGDSGVGGHRRGPYSAHLVGRHLCRHRPDRGWPEGAAVAICCANMVGFAVLSFRENRWGRLVSQGLGTSMLQMGNIVRNPRIWLPAILTSAITGPWPACSGWR